MAAFRVLDPFQTFFNLLSTAPAAGGRVDFFEAGTTTPKAVYADPGLTVSNGASVPLDAAGRLSVDCWGDGAYRARQYDVDGTLVKELDDIQPAGGAALQIPTPLEAGAFLSNDGALLLWDLIRQLPDPTGQANKFLKTDGTNFFFEAVTIPTPPAPDIVLTGTGAAGTFRAGTSDVAKKLFVMWGTATMTASSQTQASGTFNFADGSAQFDEAPRVFVVPTSATVAAEQQIPVMAVLNTGTSSFGVTMNTNDFGRSGSKITSNVPFNWVAIGFKTV